MIILCVGIRKKVVVEVYIYIKLLQADRPLSKGVIFLLPGSWVSGPACDCGICMTT